MLHLTFSDSAKFAQAAFNFVRGQSLQISHSFFSPQLISTYSPGDLFQANFLPLTSWILAFVFKFFPANDQVVALTGLLFFFLSAFLVFCIGKQLHSVKAGLVSATFFLSSLFFQEYALNFSSEAIFIFLILLFARFLLLPGKLKTISLIPLYLMFLSRQQAPAFLGGLLISGVLIFLFSRVGKKKKTYLLLSLAFLVVLSIFANRLTTGSVFSPARIAGSFNIGAGSNFGTYIRGGEYKTLGIAGLSSKVFYNFYNFVKAPERLAFPVILFLFIYSLFVKNKNKWLGFFKVFTFISLFAFMLAASATLPNARYVHPIIPLVIISAGIGLVELLKNIPKKLQNLSLVILLLFIILPTIGHYTLDARARAKQFNVGQPPAYKQIASVIAESIPQGKLIITNLDAWAAWYNGLTTMWFPLEINMLEGYQDKVDYIVITNYKEHDGDFALGEWAEVVYQSQDIANQFLNENYQLLETFTIRPADVYENQSFQGTILIRK
jgi:hypothetical protein